MTYSGRPLSAHQERLLGYLRHIATKPSMRKPGSATWLRISLWDCYDGRTMNSLLQRGLIEISEHGFRVTPLHAQWGPRTGDER